MHAYRHIYEASRHELQTWLGQSASLYPLVHRLIDTPRAGGLVDAATDLCVEAPGGSGNSFFVNGFRMINPQARVASHNHVAAQLKRSVRLAIPTLVILRNPIDCVVSRSHKAPWMISACFRQWIRFFRAVELRQSDVLIVTFEHITRDPGDVIDLVNTRFGRSFDTDFPDSKQVFSHMDDSYARAFPGDKERLRNPNQPDPGKVHLQEQIQPRVRGHRLAVTADSLYRELLDRAATGT